MQIIQSNQGNPAGVAPQTPPPAPITGATITHPNIAAPLGGAQQVGVTQQPVPLGQTGVVAPPSVAPQAVIANPGAVIPTAAPIVPGVAATIPQVAPIAQAAALGASIGTVESGIREGSGFETIPTRIQDLAPLVVEEENPEIKTQVLETLSDLGEKLASVHRMASEAYMSQGCYELAEPHLAAAATFAADDPEYHNQLGFVQFINDNMAGAIASFERVIAINPQQVDALFNLGMVLFAEAEHVRAEDCFRRVLEIVPNEAEAWNNRGACCFQSNRIADAKACFQRALEIDPANEDARLNLESF